MRVYYDGSFANKISKNNQCGTYYVAWGIVIDHQGELTEIRGSRTVNTKDMSGCHEVVAFIEAALYLLSHQIPPDEICFITDDSLTAIGSQATVANGWCSTGLNVSLENCLRKVAGRCGFYTKDVVNSVRPYLERSRFIKVKGHAKTVLNLRCDYLAEKEAIIQRGNKANIKPFLEWAADGFRRWEGEEKWWAPFTQPAEEGVTA